MRKAPQQIQYTKQPYIEDVGPRKIESIQFSLFNEADIHKASEVEVYRGEYYDHAKKPIPNGLLDSRLGPPNKLGVCATCQGGFQECPGHYGYLNLSLPVYHAGYLPTVVNILKCICKQCSRILFLEKDRLAYLKKMRGLKLDPLRKNDILKYIIKKCNAMVAGKKAMTCSRCGYINGSVKKAVKGPLGILYDRSNNDKFIEESKSALSHIKESKGLVNNSSLLDPKEVHTLLKNMLDEDCELLYLSDRPDKLIITSIPVPPTAIRPSVLVDGGTQSNENDITERLKCIIRANASVRQELTEANPSNKSLASWVELQTEVAQYINSEIRVGPPSMPAAKPLSGFVQRLKGKEGRFRSNLSGKRVEFTGRTVISPDPNLKITEVAIPILMAQILTYPEIVSRHNIEKLRQCVRNGPDKYPGAKLIKQTDGSDISLKYASRKRCADDLIYGYTVERHLQDGDVVLFNRQPSLHRMSMMSHRARIMPWRTLRFNESVCNPYNADFDGDEMNMHVPQTEEARTEALMLMGVQNNLCTPKNGEILVASTQDFLTSSFLITRKDTFYDRASFSLMCSYMGDAMDPIDLPTPALVKPVELWTGKQLFSVLIRPHAKMRVYVSLTLKEKNYDKSKNPGPETLCQKDGFVYIRNSELISGQVGKVTLGNGNKDGLYSILLRDYNAHAAAACMNRLAKLRGCPFHPILDLNFNVCVASSARWIGNHGFSIGIDDVQPGERLSGTKEQIVQAGYGKADDLINKFNRGELQSLPGLDASETLESEISSELNEIRENTGKECMNSLHWRNSPLIMSQCGSKGSPINISQMVACVGQQIVGGHRAPNGFIDRSLPHFPKYSRTPSAKGFVQNSFYTGLSAVEFFFHTMGGREGLVDTAVKTADTGYMSRRLMKALEDLYIHYDNTVRNASSCIIQFMYGDDGMDPSQMEAKDGQPLNFDRLLMKAKATCPAIEQISMSPDEIYQKTLEVLVDHGIVSQGEENNKVPQLAEQKSFGQSLLEFVLKKMKSLEETQKRLKLDGEDDADSCPESDQNVALNASGLTSKQLEVFLKTCLGRYKSKKIESGTAIGAIGAQSIGEPGTQMTLKTFHFAGVASMNVTLGVPRIKEIINASKNIGTPIIDAKLERNNDDAKSAIVVKGRIEKTLLGQVAKSVKIVMSSRRASIVVTLDMKVIQASLLSIDAYSVKQSILQTKGLKLKDGEKKNAKGQVKVLNTSKLEVNLFMDKKNLHFELHSLKNRLPTVVVKGIHTIERVVISNEKEHKERCQLFVEGTGLLAVMGTEGIDGTKTISNNIEEVYRTLGIEVARRIIIDEIKKIVEAYGITIDIRHMMLLAETMTYKGEILGINRHGMHKMKDSVLMLASFEKTADHLFNASVNGREDKIEGVSECIIMGIPMHFGTGLLKVRQSMPPVELKYGPDPIIS